MRILFISVLSLLMIGCNTDTQPPLIQKQYIVVDVPGQYFTQCKPVKLPDPTHLTNIQLSNLLIQLDSMDKKCVNSINAIKEFLEKAKITVEQSNGNQ